MCKYEQLQPFVHSEPTLFHFEYIEKDETIQIYSNITPGLHTENGPWQGSFGRHRTNKQANRTCYIATDGVWFGILRASLMMGLYRACNMINLLYT